MPESLIEQLRKKTAEAQENMALEKKRAEITEKQRKAREHKKKMEEAHALASKLFDESQAGIAWAAEKGKNSYRVCNVESNVFNPYEQVIANKFVKAGFKVDWDREEIPGTGHTTYDDGVYWCDYYYYLVVSW